MPKRSGVKSSENLKFRVTVEDWFDVYTETANVVTSFS